MKSILIVLGNPPKPDGSIGFNLRSRLDVAVQEYRRGSVEKVILTGGAVYNEYTEAEVMAAYFLEKRVSPEDLILEKKARNTYDNALDSALALKGIRHGKIIVVTSRFHKMRAKRIFSCYFDSFSILVPSFSPLYFLRNIHIYLWELYLTLKLQIKGDSRLARTVNDLSAT